MKCKKITMFTLLSCLILFGITYAPAVHAGIIKETLQKNVTETNTKITAKLTQIHDNIQDLKSNNIAPQGLWNFSFIRQFLYITTFLLWILSFGIWALNTAILLPFGLAYSYGSEHNKPILTIISLLLASPLLLLEGITTLLMGGTLLLFLAALSWEPIQGIQPPSMLLKQTIT